MRGTVQSLVQTWLNPTIQHIGKYLLREKDALPHIVPFEQRYSDLDHQMEMLEPWSLLHWHVGFRLRDNQIDAEPLLSVSKDILGWWV